MIEKIKLLNIWKNNPFAEFSISEIMKHSQKITKTWVFNTLKDFTDKKILIEKRKANINVYSLNIENPLSFQFLSFLELLENTQFEHIKIISEIIKKIPIKCYSLVIFGSYVNNKQTKKSDLDICFLLDEQKTEKKIIPYVNDIKLSTSIKIHEHYIAIEEFVKMLLLEEENLGKQILRNHKLFYNPEIYYQTIKEAFKNGFRI